MKKVILATLAISLAACSTGRFEQMELKLAAVDAKASLANSVAIAADSKATDAMHLATSADAAAKDAVEAVSRMAEKCCRK